MADNSLESAMARASLLVIIGEPLSPDHKELILGEVTKGLRSWNTEASGINIHDELAAISDRASAGEEGPDGERVIQHNSDSLLTEILVNPQAQTVRRSLKHFLTTPTQYKHIIYSGHCFQGSGAWILQDDTFSFGNWIQIFRDPDIENALKQQENVVLNICCLAEGDWKASSIAKQDFCKIITVNFNPDENVSDINGVLRFTAYVGSLITSPSISKLLPSSDVVGNVRFVRPTVYIFPACQGDSALLGISGFNLLVNGGYNRRPCFWNFIRYLDRIDSVLVTHLGTDNLFGVSSMLQRKSIENIHPEIGHVFMNAIEKVKHSGSGENGTNLTLTVNLSEEGSRIQEYSHAIGQSANSCVRSSANSNLEPINLYHKVGHGKLDMYVLNPVQDSRELKDFFLNWNKMASNYGIHQNFPLQYTMSVCVLVVWIPSSPTENITRVFFPGSAPQAKVIEGLEKVKHLNFLKHPECCDNDLHAKSIKRPGTASGLTKPQRPLSAALNKSAVPVKTEPIKKAVSEKVTAISKPAPIKSTVNKAVKEDSNKKVAKDKNGKEKIDKSKSPSPTKSSPTKSMSPIKSPTATSTPSEVSSAGEVKSEEHPVTAPVLHIATETETSQPQPALANNLLVADHESKAEAEQDLLGDLTHVSTSEAPEGQVPLEPKPSSIPLLADVSPDPLPDPLVFPEASAVHEPPINNQTYMDKQKMEELGIYDEDSEIPADEIQPSPRSVSPNDEAYQLHRDQEIMPDDSTLPEAEQPESGALSPESETAEDDVQPEALPEPVAIPAFAPDQDMFGVVSSQPDLIPLSEKIYTEAEDLKKSQPEIVDDIIAVDESEVCQHVEQQESQPKLEAELAQPVVTEDLEQFKEPVPEHKESVPDHDEPEPVQDQGQQNQTPVLGHEEVLLAHEEQVPAEDEPVAAQDELVPAHDELDPVQDHEPEVDQKPVPGHEEPLPDHAEPVRAHAEPVLAHAEPVQDHDEHVPSCDEPVAARDELLQDHEIDQDQQQQEPSKDVSEEFEHIRMEEAGLQNENVERDSLERDIPQGAVSSVTERDSLERDVDASVPDEDIDAEDITADKDKLTMEDLGIYDDGNVDEEDEGECGGVDEDAPEFQYVKQTPEKSEVQTAQPMSSPETDADAGSTLPEAFEKDDSPPPANQGKAVANDTHDADEEIRDTDSIDSGTPEDEDEKDIDELANVQQVQGENVDYPDPEQYPADHPQHQSVGEYAQYGETPPEMYATDQYPEQPGSEHYPQQPGYEQYTQQPGYEQYPQQPGYEQYPQQSGYEQYPQEPGYQQYPQHPGYMDPQYDYADPYQQDQAGYEYPANYPHMQQQQQPWEGTTPLEHDGSQVGVQPLESLPANVHEVPAQGNDVNPFVGIKNEAAFQQQKRSDEGSAGSFDPATEWGQPMGLPSPMEPGAVGGGSATKAPAVNGASAKARATKPTENGPAKSDDKKAATGIAKKTTETRKLPTAGASRPTAAKPTPAKTSTTSRQKSAGLANGDAKPTSRLSSGTSAAKKLPTTTNPTKNARTVAPSKSPAAPASARRPVPAASSARVGKSAASASKPAAPLPPVVPYYMDLTYIPHHGETNYVDIEFFRRVRARYYVLSTLSPNPQTLNALLEAKQTWEDKELRVTLIPTYDNDTLRHWMALHADQLNDSKIEIAPAASRCTIQLQDHETTCSAYRLEF